MKKVICLILVLCMLFGALPALANEAPVKTEEAGGFIYVREGDHAVITSVVKGNDRTTYFYSSEKGFYNAVNNDTLCVPSVINGLVVEIAKEAFAGYNGYKKVVFEEGIYVLPEGVCRGMPNLEEVVLPASLVEIGPFAFSGCNKLKKITPINLDKVGDGAFTNCENLVVEVNHIGSEGKGVFDGCKEVITANKTTSDKAGNTKNKKNPIVNVNAKGVFNDVKAESELYNQVELLSQLGIMDGFEDGEFKLNETLTRAQAATVIVRLLNKESEIVEGEASFSDVPESHWAACYINLACKEGIINGMGDKTFCPEDMVTYHQFIKMLCCTLGYSVAAEKTYGGWKNDGYIKVAEILKLTKGIEFEKDAPVTREHVVEMVYKALDIELLDENVASVGLYGDIETDNDQVKTIITTYFDYQIVVGILHSNTSLEVTRSYNKSREYYAVGDLINFTTKCDNLEHLAGKTVTAYVKKTRSGENVLLTAVERPGT